MTDGDGSAQPTPTPMQRLADPVRWLARPGRSSEPRSSSSSSSSRSIAPVDRIVVEDDLFLECLQRIVQRDFFPGDEGSGRGEVGGVAEVLAGFRLPDADPVSDASLAAGGKVAEEVVRRGVSLDLFLSKFCSEDDFEAQQLLRSDVREHRERHWWAYEVPDRGERREQVLERSRYGRIVREMKALAPPPTPAPPMHHRTRQSDNPALLTNSSGVVGGMALRDARKLEGLGRDEGMQLADSMRVKRRKRKREGGVSLEKVGEAVSISLLPPPPRPSSSSSSSSSSALIPTTTTATTTTSSSSSSSSSSPPLSFGPVTLASKTRFPAGYLERRDALAEAMARVEGGGGLRRVGDSGFGTFSGKTPNPPSLLVTPSPMPGTGDGVHAPPPWTIATLLAPPQVLEEGRGGEGGRAEEELRRERERRRERRRRGEERGLRDSTIHLRTRITPAFPTPLHHHHHHPPPSHRQTSRHPTPGASISQRMASLTPSAQRLAKSFLNRSRK